MSRPRNGIEAKRNTPPPRPPHGPEETVTRTDHGDYSVTRLWVNPFRYFRMDPAAFPHVTYDPTLRRLRADHYRIRSASGDGTQLHEVWAMEDAFYPILEGRARSNNNPEGCITGYTVGPARIASIDGVPVMLNCGGPYTGTRCHIGIPLLIHYL